MRQHWLEMIVLTFIIIVLIGACSYGGCPAPRIETPPENEIHYFRDNRTGICFAQVGIPSGDPRNNYTFTQVPCDLAFKEIK